MKRILVCLLLLGGWALFSQEVFIREINGTVEVRAPGSGDWGRAEAGQRLDRKAVISTGFKSTAVLAVGNSVLMVQPLTRLSVEELEEIGGRELVDIQLQAGRIRVDVRPPAEGRTEFTVRSPIATASVRGTSFEFDGMDLQVDEGRVYLSGGDRGGTYVGTGGEARADPETGRIAGSGELAREGLTPSLPAGVDGGGGFQPGETEGGAILPPAGIGGTPEPDPPSAGDIDAGIKWE